MVETFSGKSAQHQNWEKNITLYLKTVVVVQVHMTESKKISTIRYKVE